MKTSEIYKKAIAAVIMSEESRISFDEQLEIIEFLGKKKLAEEAIERWREEKPPAGGEDRGRHGQKPKNTAPIMGQK